MPLAGKRGEKWSEQAGKFHWKDTAELNLYILNKTDHKISQRFLNKMPEHDWQRISEILETLVGILALLSDVQNFVILKRISNSKEVRNHFRFIGTFYQT